jgi:hypothetical protein
MLPLRFLLDVFLLFAIGCPHVELREINLRKSGIRTGIHEGQLGGDSTAEAQHDGTNAQKPKRVLESEACAGRNCDQRHI